MVLTTIVQHLNLSIFRTGAISYLFQEVGHLVIIPFKFDMTWLVSGAYNCANLCISLDEVQNCNKTEAKHIVTEAKVNHDTQFYRIKGRGGVPPPPPPITSDLWQSWWNFMNPAPSMTESRIHKNLWISSILSKLLVGEGEALHPHLLFCEIVYRLLFCPDFASPKEVAEFQ